jgi:hypothetical protein
VSATRWSRRSSIVSCPTSLNSSRTCSVRRLSGSKLYAVRGMLCASTPSTCSLRRRRSHPPGGCSSKRPQCAAPHRLTLRLESKLQTGHDLSTEYRRRLTGRGQQCAGIADSGHLGKPSRATLWTRPLSTARRMSPTKQSEAALKAPQLSATAPTRTLRRKSSVDR